MTLLIVSWLVHPRISSCADFYALHKDRRRPQEHTHTCINTHAHKQNLRTTIFNLVHLQVYTACTYIFTGIYQTIYYTE